MKLCDSTLGPPEAPAGVRKKKKLCLSEPAAGSCFVIGQCFSRVDAKEAEEGQEGADLQESPAERSEQPQQAALPRLLLPDGEAGLLSSSFLFSCLRTSQLGHRDKDITVNQGLLTITFF